jgi:hypothetical protein
VGPQHVGAFNVVLTDATAGVTIGTQSIQALAMGVATTATFNWNTSGAAFGGHTLVATHTLADGNPADNQGSTVVTVNPVATDVAITALSVPAAVNRGSTATVTVTLQNTGGQAVNQSFAVALTDATAGVTIGTQTLTTLAVNATTTRSFSWNTASAALGGHTLVATHTLPDQSAANNQRSAATTVVASPPDIALTSLTAPGQVTVGDTVPVVVTVQNVGGLDVTGGFDIVVTDGGATGPVVATETINGLAIGASATRTLSWNTGAVTLGSHTLIATQKFPDNNASNNARAVGIAVNLPTLHVGNLDGSAAISGTLWTAGVQITAHDLKHGPVAGVTVRGYWYPGYGTAECLTSETGACTVSFQAIPIATRMVSFAVTGLTRSGATYKSAGNHDPDGNSNGYSITVKNF